MSEVKKVIKVFEDGAYEDVEHGVLIGCNGDDFNLQFMDVSQWICAGQQSDLWKE